MSKMLVDRLSRTGSATSAIRQLVAHQGKVRRVLSTPIEKVEWDLEFRNTHGTVPVEQYAFKVKGTVYERFADATAAVMALHHVELAANEVADAQIYVQKACQIIDGNEKIRILKVLPDNARPARVAIAA